MLGSCGDGGEDVFPTPPVTPILEEFAGHVGGGPGSADGTGTEASFSYPRGVATDNAANVYVADSSNNTIRKITPAGVVTTLAGTAGVPGTADGTGAAASFNYPQGVATDSAGNVYVADSLNGTIRKITPEGVVTTLAGTAEVAGSSDGVGAAASFNFPSGVAADSVGNVYVADSNNNTIRKITPAGVVTTLAGTAGVAGSDDGTGATASFDSPQGVAADSAGNVYVADTNNNAIRKVTPAGVVTTLAGIAGALGGSADGTGAAASFLWPTGVSADSTGNVYVADSNNNTIRKITPAGVVTTLAGTAGVAGSADGTGASASFHSPRGVATDNAGNVYVADYYNHTIRKITPAGVVTTLAGMAVVIGSADGIGVVASFNSPQGVATDSAGNVYVADTINHTIRKITPAGVVSTLAGTAGVAGSADGVGAGASFNFPLSVATDSAGNVYVLDVIFNQRIGGTGGAIIRKITPAGEVSTLAGLAMVIGSVPPIGLATDNAGNLYVADVFDHTILKITPEGVVSTLAGTAGVAGSADGVGAAASFLQPRGVATDSADNVYVWDNYTIRRITPAGVVTTLAGTPGVQGSSDGTGAAASFSFASGLATDSNNNIYVADTGNYLIRKITPAGVVTTVVGTLGIAGFVPGDLPGVLKPGDVSLSGRTMYITAGNGIARVTNVP